MKMLKFHRVFFGILLVAWNERVHGAPLAYASLDGIVAASDIVVVGQIIDIEWSSYAGRITLAPLETLKGSLVPGPLVVHFKELALGKAESLKSKRTLVFAKRADRGEYTLLPLAMGSTASLDQQLLTSESPTVPANLQKNETDTPLRKVVKEVAVIHLSSPKADVLFYLRELASAHIEPELTTIVFEDIARSMRAGALVDGTAGLLALGDLEGLEFVDATQGRARTDLTPYLSELERSYQSTSPRGI